MHGFEKGQLNDYTELAKAISAAEVNPECYNYPDAFFPEVGDAGSDSLWAKKMCSECPVLAQCADYAIKWEDHGVWGGLSPRQRQKLRSRMHGKRYMIPYSDEDRVA